jgi:hypothetical protein
MRRDLPGHDRDYRRRQACSTNSLVASVCLLGTRGRSKRCASIPVQIVEPSLNPAACGSPLLRAHVRALVPKPQAVADALFKGVLPGTQSKSSTLEGQFARRRRAWLLACPVRALP